jgi:hypothetical protein
MPRVVQYILHRPEAQHTPCPFPHPPHTGRPLYPTIHTLSTYPASPPRPVLRLRWANETHIMMGTQAAGQKEMWQYLSSVCRTLVHGAHIQATSRSLVQRPHHLTTCRSEVSLRLCQRLSSSAAPPRAMPSSFTAAPRLPFRLLSPLHTPAWRSAPH